MTRLNEIRERYSDPDGYDGTADDVAWLLAEIDSLRLSLEYQDGQTESLHAEVARRDKVLDEVRRLGMRWLHLSAEAMDQDVREWTGAAGKSVLAALDTSGTEESP